MTSLRDRLLTARAVYGLRRRRLGERLVRPNRRAPPPLDYPYREAGAGEPLVLVHGLVDQQEAWRFGVGEWAKRFRTVSLDLPGCNHMPRRGEASVGGYADFLHEFSTSIGLERFVLVGLSFGAKVVLEYAARHPKRVAGAVLAALPLARPNESSQRVAAFLARHKGGRLLPAVIGAVKGSRPYLHLVVNAVTHRSKDNFDFNVSLIAQGLADSDARTWIDNYQSTLEFDAESRLDDLARAGVPYLAVFGELDRGAPPERRRAVAALEGRSLVVPGANHCVHLEASDAFNAAVADFCAGLGRSR